MTAGERLVNHDGWRAAIRANEADYATDEWKADALSTVDESAAYLAELDPDYPLPGFRDVWLSGPHGVDSPFSPPEWWAIVWQYERHLQLGSFTRDLLQLASKADGSNADRLALAWPDLVEGIRRWRSEASFARRIRALLDEGQR